MDYCNEGNGEACYITGFSYHKYPEIRDDSKSVSAFTRGCEVGNLESCGNLGLMNEKGWGTEKNLQRAIDLYEHTCSAGVAVHCRNVGRLSEGDSGFPVDLERAETAYQRALELALTQCESKVPESCAVAGHMYKDGKGTEKNPIRARELLKKSCKMGYSWACKSL